MFRQFLPLFTEIYRSDELAVNENVKKSCSQSDRINFGINLLNTTWRENI
jgi:hypothetical protein